MLPSVRYAVDAYLALVRDSPLLVAVASSLTELFSRDLISLRIDKMRLHYPYMVDGLAYFEGRLTQAPEDAEFALDYVSSHAETRSQQEQVVSALEQKCAILWAQLDAIDYAYVTPGNIPPGCFVPHCDWMLSGRVSMDMNSIPMVVRGCRLHPTQDVLLMPEGTLELNGPSRDVLARVDGNRNVAGIVQELLQEYEGAEEAEIRTDVLALLQDLKNRGVLRERT